MKKTIFKRFAALALCAGMVSSTALAANTIYKNIRVEYSGIKLVVDGQTVVPKDANGKTVEPFIYNGTTYLPVRAVGNAVGKKVKWDGNSRTVYLGATPNESGDVYMEPYQTSSLTLYKPEKGKSFYMMGVPYSQGFTAGWFDHGIALYNLNGEYSSVSMDVGHQDNCSADDKTLNFFVDDELIDTYNLTGDMQTRHITLPLNHGLQLKIDMRGVGAYGIGNITFHR